MTAENEKTHVQCHCGYAFMALNNNNNGYGSANPMNVGDQAFKLQKEISASGIIYGLSEKLTDELSPQHGSRNNFITRFPFQLALRKVNMM